MFGIYCVLRVVTRYKDGDVMDVDGDGSKTTSTTAAASAKTADGHGRGSSDKNTAGSSSATAASKSTSDSQSGGSNNAPLSKQAVTKDSAKSDAAVSGKEEGVSGDATGGVRGRVGERSRGAAAVAQKSDNKAAALGNSRAPEALAEASGKGNDSKAKAGVEGGDCDKMDVDEDEDRDEDGSEDTDLVDGVQLVEYLWGGGVEPSKRNSRERSAESKHCSADTHGSSSSPASVDKTSADRAPKSVQKVSAPPDMNKDSQALLSPQNQSYTWPSNGRNDESRPREDEVDALVREAALVRAAEEALAPSFTRDLRRRYLAQSLARIVGAAGVIQEGRRSAACCSSGAGPLSSQSSTSPTPCAAASGAEAGAATQSSSLAASSKSQTGAGDASESTGGSGAPGNAAGNVPGTESGAVPGNNIDKDFGNGGTPVEDHKVRNQNKESSREGAAAKAGTSEVQKIGALQQKVELWTEARDQAAAAVEALDALDRGVEELLIEVRTGEC